LLHQNARNEIFSGKPGQSLIKRQAVNLIYVVVTQRVDFFTETAQPGCGPGCLKKLPGEGFKGQNRRR
jgi:hypothetical protein